MTLWKWSQIAATNANVDSTCPFPEGMAPSALNDGTRGMMAAVAKYRDDIAGAIVTSGTSTAYTVSSYQQFDSFPHMDGKTIAFTPHVTNGDGPVTLNVDGLGGRGMTTVNAVNLVAGMLIAGTPYLATYTDGIGQWRLHGFYGNPFNVPIGAVIPYVGATPPSSNFVFPSGQGLSRTTYAALFAQTSTMYGAGDGSTTFNVIDMRGNTPVCQDQGVGRVPGLGMGTYTGQSSIVLGMTHLPAAPVAIGGATTGYSPTVGGGLALAIANGTTPVAFSQAGGNATYNNNQFGAIAGFSSLAVSGNTANLGNSTAFTNVQPSVGVNYILRVI
jgi:microcystin-dependent protein